MNTLKIQGEWNIAKGIIKQKWANLTEDDLIYKEGQIDELVGRIQKKTGETRADIQHVVKEAFRK